MVSQQVRFPAHPLAWIAAGALSLLGAMALMAPAANAGPLVASAPACSDFEMSQTFLPWLDPAYYILNPGGDFENGAAGWSLNGAKVVKGNESYYVGGSGDSRSLSVPRGSSPVSSTVCVGLDHPTVRLFARNTGSLLSTLTVYVHFEDALGGVHSAPIGEVATTRSWQPTLPMVIGVNLLPLLPDDYTPVAFSFKASGGEWTIDDFYVDPRRH